MAHIDALLAALADPTRRKLLERLAREPARVTDLAAPLPMTLAAVSKHLRVLEKAGLVRRSRQGREHRLELNAARLRQVATWASRYERYWTTRLDRMEAFFNEKGSKP
jgi:DNA-binding transcriptional ArsR family regulator